MKYKQPIRAKERRSPAESSLLYHLLSNPALRGNGPPDWRNAPSLAKASVRRRKTVKRLRRLSRKFPGARVVADRLANCTGRAPCGSGACPICLRTMQRWTVAAVRDWVQAHPGDSLQLVTISWVPPQGRGSLTQLNGHVLDTVKRDFRSALAAIPTVQVGIFGIDLSLNDEEAKGNGTAWQLHLYGVSVLGPELAPRQLSQQLRANFKKQPEGSRPVRVRHCDAGEYAISYTFKTGFVRRVSYRYAAHGGITWNTRSLGLKASQDVELLLHLDGLGIAKRFVMHNWRAARKGNRVHLAPRSKLA